MPTMQEAATSLPPYLAMGRRIRRARMEMALDQFAFAGKLGVGRRSVQDWEYGRVRPQMRHLDRLELVTGKTLEWFLHGLTDDEL